MPGQYLLDQPKDGPHKKGLACGQQKLDTFYSQKLLSTDFMLPYRAHKLK